MDYPGRLIAGLTVIILLILFPLQYIAQSSSEDIDALVCNETKAFADSIRKKGYIDQEMYEEYINFLNQTGELYDLEIEDIHPLVGDELTKHIFHQQFANTMVNNSMMGKTATHALYLHNDEHLENLIETSNPAEHIHSSDCYAGHRHDQSNCGLRYFYTGEAVNYRGSAGNSETSYSRYTNVNLYCGKCGGSIALALYDQSKRGLSINNQSDILNFFVYYLNQNNQVSSKNMTVNKHLISTVDDGTGWQQGSGFYYKINPQWDIYYPIFESVYWSSRYGSVDISSWTVIGYKTEYSCPWCLADGRLSKTLTSEWACGQEEDSNPICDRVVTGITATKPSQTVALGSYIDTTAQAAYLDGHTGIVDCVASGYEPNVLGNQTVTLTYSGFIHNAKTSGELTCTVNVLVVPAKSLSYITVTPSTQTVERYSNPEFIVTAYYDDGTNAVIDAGKYTITGFNAEKIGIQTVTVSYMEMGVTKTASVTVNVTVLHKKCPICHNTYDMNPDDSDPGCPFCKELVIGIEASPIYAEVTQGDTLPITVQAIYRDRSRKTVYGWISDYDPDKLGLQTVTVEYGGYAASVTVYVKEYTVTCPECGTKYPVSYGECPVCSENVISITVEPSSVTVRQYEKIDIIVTAYFANGSSRIVDDWGIDCTTASPGRYKATVTYKTASTTIDLTVIADTDEQCPICGLIYDPIENPNGCPVCFTALTGIEAYLLNGSNKVQYGTMPDIGVILIFRDEHREMVTDGYTVENYNPYTLGMQTITVKYESFSTGLTVEVVNTLSSVICPNGHVYYLDEDGTDPGCPYCRLEGSHSTVRYYDIKYTSEILDELYENGVYRFDKGNFITIRLIKRDKSVLYQLQNMFFKTTLPGRMKKFIFGGEVY